jgi:ubiquinone/menaquinone biosynthesis C-methylase UbiE
MTEAKRYAWLLDEVASAGRENLDTAHASKYDTKEDAAAAEEIRLLRQLGLDGTSHLVDIGAGTGQLAVAAARVCARVVAVDVSPVMLSVLREKVRAANLSSLEIIEGGFLTYEHRGREADFVYSRYALHHLPDFWKAVALERIRRVVRRGGVLRLWDVVYGFEPREAERRLEGWCEVWEDAAGDGWNRSDVEEHIRDEHSTFTWLLEPMLERAGFEIEDASYSPDKLFARYVARAI